MKKILLELELTNLCNARCLMCPVADMNREKGFMTPKTFQLLIKKGVDYGIERIRFCGLGEPLLHDDFCEYLSQVKQQGLSAELITNGSLLESDIVECLVQNNIDTLSVSLPSLNKEHYETIMRGLQFEKVFEKTLFAVRQLKQRTSTNIRITSVVTPINRDESQQIKQFWAQEGIDYHELHTAHNRGGHLKEMERLNLSQDEGKVVHSQKKPMCAWPLRQFFIGWNGSVYLCCCDVEGKYIVGNVFDDEFPEMEKRQETITLSQTELCRNCSYPEAKVLP